MPVKQLLRWFLAAFLLRVFLLSLVIFSASRQFPDRMQGLVFYQDDYDFFLLPVEHYFEHGVMDYKGKPGVPFAGRMPGYMVPYYLLRLLANKTIAINLLIIFQIILSAMSVVVLSTLAVRLFKDQRAFLPVFLLILLSFHLFVFDLFTLTESFSVSAFCFFLFFSYRFYEKRRHRDALLAGLFMAWAVFLRPFMGTLLILFPLLMLLMKGFSLKSWLRYSIIFSLPFIVFEAAWITRNYIRLHRFIPLETSLTESYGEYGAYRKSAIAVRQLIYAWGGETGEFYQGSEAEWFHFTPLEKAREFRFKSSIFDSGITVDSLIELKRIFNASLDTLHLNAAELEANNILAASIAQRWADRFRQHNPVRYYLVNPVIRFFSLLKSNATMLIPFPPFSKMALWQKGIKLFAMLLYYLILSAGFLGMLVFLFRDRGRSPYLMMLFISIWLLLFTVIAASSIMQFRYILPATPVWILFAVLLLKPTMDSTRTIHQN
ncbi:MAG: hypothetical protein LC117_08310 [Bacteroidia bacterium]|nr:glycosyltransferase family 39 protein [Bacteroidia bacterium]MCZ2277914.1 hypothetical protein [Bacteroidia bacterium]